MVVFVTLRELTAHYVKAYKKGPLNSETRKAYEELKRVGDTLGQELTSQFFKQLVERYSVKSNDYEKMTVKELDQAILSQYRSYMKQFEDVRKDKANCVVKRPQNKRRSSFEIK